MISIFSSASYARATAKVTGLLSLSLLLGACGGSGGFKGIIQSLKVDKRIDSSTQDLMLDVTTEVGVGNLQFQTLTIPIGDPDKPLEQYGTVTLRRNSVGKNELVLSMNISEIANTQATLDNKLPNGRDVPVAGVSDMISIPVSRAGKFYFDAGSGRTILGVAIGIKEFKEVGKYLPGIDIFFDIPVSNKVTGVAGVFTGLGDRDNGLALFVDVTEVLRSSSKNLSVAALNLETTYAPLASEAGVEFVSNAEVLETRSGRKMAEKMYKFSRERLKLNVIR